MPRTLARSVPHLLGVLIERRRDVSDSGRRVWGERTMNMTDPAVSLRDVRERTAQRVAELLDVFDTIVESSWAGHLEQPASALDATVAFDRAQISSIVEHARTQLAEINKTLDELHDRGIISS
jgi:hypothetical protein